MADWVGRGMLLTWMLLHPVLLRGRVLVVLLISLLDILVIAGVSRLMMHQWAVTDVKWSNWLLRRLVL